ISSKRLNSQDAFILMYREKGLVTKQLAWFGEGSNEVLREATRKLAKVLVKSYASVPSSNVVETLPSVEMEEGKESSHKEWKKALGDKAYPNAAFLKKHGLKRRLFACSSTSGAFSVEEVFDFAQEDLEPSSIFFLDIWGEVYVWIGSKSYEEDERMGMATAVDFVAAATDGRLRNTPVYAFREGEEPIEFTCNFQAWDDGTGKLKVKRSKKKKKSSSGSSSSSVKSVVKKSSSKKSKDSKDKSSYTPSPKGSNVRAILAEYNRVWTYAELTEAVKQAQTPAGQAKLKGLDKTKLEQYLSDEEFQKHVGMSKQDFYALPLWKQTNKRQEIGLY
ncbi:Villin headpiece domain containing protein, partial [Balamuthia mandrillaris]